MNNQNYLHLIIIRLMIIVQNFLKSYMIKVINYIRKIILTMPFRYQINQQNQIPITIILSGSCLRLLKQYENAITQLDKGIAINPEHINSLSEKGECLRLLKQYDESLNLLDKALSINQQQNCLFNLNGVCLFDQKKSQEAMIYYEQSLKIDPNNQNTIDKKGIL
ncbi:unnamed protein product [Paramecium sonneborni]|uniref:Tetratricopeptide repeat protein n=1 Tax=Paramecium sonneborni TaxID=65129 RepID=A0A8S1RPU2_9CILI|nr:unnamed protein product [Paramecium sonneborni]